jgi:lambda family phage minor tail protein L
MANLVELSQTSEIGTFVDLYTIDLTSVGGDVRYWTPSHATGDTPLVWNGHSYTHVDIQIEGFAKVTSGSLPRPQVGISNAFNVVGALAALYGDLIGCPITRTKTLYEYLDDQPGADNTQYWPLEIYRVERKVSQNKNKVVFELSSVIDSPNARLPRQLMSRDVCLLRYRRFVNGSFDYTKATCPYVGGAYYDRDGNQVSASLDVCGKKVSDCKLRFGANATLPFGGFPGLGRV